MDEQPGSGPLEAAARFEAWVDGRVRMVGPSRAARHALMASKVLLPRPTIPTKAQRPTAGHEATPRKRQRRPAAGRATPITAGPTGAG